MAEALKGVSGMEALCDLARIEYHGAKRAGSARQTEEKNDIAQSQSGNAESYDPFKDPEKARKRQGWPVFEVPTSAEIEAIATIRGLSPEGVALAAERGLLFTRRLQGTPRLGHHRFPPPKCPGTPPRRKSMGADWR